MASRIVVRLSALMVLVGGLALLGWPAEATAQQRDRGRRMSPERQKAMIQENPGIDADGDGAISSDEMRTFWSQRQPNSNGQRSDRGRGDRGDRGDRGGRDGRNDRGPGRFEDYRRRGEEMLKQHPEADTNGDGRLSGDEMRDYARANPEVYREHLQQNHPEADANKDGQISDDEMQAARSRFSDRMSREIIQRHPDADKDGDGKLNEAEMQAFRSGFEDRMRQDILRRHPEADKDRDGKLSETEMQAVRERFDRSSRDRERSRDGRRADVPERDPWAQYVEQFSTRYKLTAAQQSTAQSVLREFTARRAKLQEEQAKPGDEAPDASQIKASKKAIDALFAEMKQRLEQIPTTDQMQNAKPAGKPQ